MDETVVSTSLALASKFATIHTGCRPHPYLFWSIFACNSNMTGFTMSKKNKKLDVNKLVLM